MWQVEVPLADAVDAMLLIAVDEVVVVAAVNQIVYLLSLFVAGGV